MSSVFDDTLKSASDSFFLLPGAEWVTYKPRAGAARRIRAVVTRNPESNVPGVEGGSLPPFEVLVKNDETAGIASEDVDTGGDEIELGRRVDRLPATVRIARIIDQDAGLMLLAAQ